MPLTAEQQARLDALPTATCDMVLTWLLTGDPILVAEARKKLVPPRLLLAFEQATGPKVRNPGAIFMHVLRGSG